MKKAERIRRKENDKLIERIGGGKKGDGKGKRKIKERRG